MGIDVAERIVATIAPNGMVTGGGKVVVAATIPAEMRVLVDGAYWATVPVVASNEGGEPTWSFTCSLPPVDKPKTVTVDLVALGADRDVEGRLVRRLEGVVREPLLNQHGLSAADVLETTQTPLFGVPWLSFDGARLTVSGAHLPPQGDPSQLAVRFGPGVKFDFRHGLLGPEFGNHFWYWPNAHLSNFLLTIDLAASRPGSNPFFFDFIYGRRPELLSSKPLALRQRVWIPSALTAFVGYPVDASQLTRVQTWSSAQSVAFTGYNAFKTIEALLLKHGVVRGPDTAILDWGCGHGRVTRHFINFWPESKISGADIDDENVVWCQQNLNGGAFTTVPLLPPSSLADGSFDAVFGISVVTHLTARAQSLWLQEIRRILKPGGLAILSFGGASAAAWGSFWHKPDWWRNWIETGFDDTIADPALDGKIAETTYYRHTAQSAGWTRDKWAEHFEFLNIYTDGIGNQDIAVLRRRRS